MCFDTEILLLETVSAHPAMLPQFRMSDPEQSVSSGSIATTPNSEDSAILHPLLNVKERLIGDNSPGTSIADLSILFLGHELAQP
jgi:hypothetical protein